MIRSLRAFFLSRLFREKLLLVVFAGLGVVLWFFSFNKRFVRFWAEQRQTSSSLADQQRWLDSRDAVQQAAQKAADLLVPSKTYNSTGLLEMVQRLASEAGLVAAQSNPQPTTSSAQFSIHTLEFTARQADWPPLKKFYESLLAKAPYISIEKFTLTLANGKHSLVLTVSSFEAAR